MNLDPLGPLGPLELSSHLAELPPSKFWSGNGVRKLSELFSDGGTATVKLSPQPGSPPVEDFWDKDFGLHPNSPSWHGVSKMMIRNVPARWAQRCERNHKEGDPKGSFSSFDFLPMMFHWIFSWQKPKDS